MAGKGGLDGRIGRTAMLLALADDPEAERALTREAESLGFRVVKGRVGSMEPEKVVAAIDTACRRCGLITEEGYREEHALYHAILEALHGVLRGQVAFGSILRTVGLSFAVVRGPRRPEAGGGDGDWVVVALYGTIGAPVRGWEHEVCGMGVNHL